MYESFLIDNIYKKFIKNVDFFNICTYNINEFIYWGEYMDKLNYKKIGERLRKLRKYMGLTQEQVANILNLGRDAVLRIEKGSRKIDLQELVDFSKLYNISMDELTNERPTVSTNDIAFARGYNELSEKDKKEIMRLIEYKNMLKGQNKEE